MKKIKAQFDASELITKQTVVSQQINTLLTERAIHFGLILDDISIVSGVNFDSRRGNIHNIQEICRGICMIIKMCKGKKIDNI